MCIHTNQVIEALGFKIVQTPNPTAGLMILSKTLVFLCFLSDDRHLKYQKRIMDSPKDF